MHFNSRVRVAVCASVRTCIFRLDAPCTHSNARMHAARECPYVRGRHPEKAPAYLFVNGASKEEMQQVLKSKEAFTKEINKIMEGDVEWGKYTPLSEQELAADRELLVELHARRAPHLAEQAWKASLLPCGHLIRRKPDGYVGFVLRAYKRACLMWPAVSNRLNMWEMRPDVETLDFMFVFDFADFEEIPLDIWSPVHMFLEDGAPCLVILFAFLDAALVCNVTCTARIRWHVYGYVAHEMVSHMQVPSCMLAGWPYHV